MRLRNVDMRSVAIHLVESLSRFLEQCQDDLENYVEKQDNLLPQEERDAFHSNEIFPQILSRLNLNLNVARLRNQLMSNAEPWPGLTLEEANGALLHLGMTICESFYGTVPLRSVMSEISNWIERLIETPEQSEFVERTLANVKQIMESVRGPLLANCATAIIQVEDESGDFLPRLEGPSDDLRLILYGYLDKLETLEEPDLVNYNDSGTYTNTQPKRWN